ncbi:hypothetical protein PS934_03264 [Pseudomonas fluorescens]|uniref:hypothetical protein n=1 Tax=Pseudomonas fluorescens TaxID=294 RepID=UPI001241302D|nr:hypothetical protein [Pseudomonas fluorescens]VVQ07842.1 hypothetical protein PS934_03264 [Pseudomonas fluorescens]
MEKLSLNKSKAGPLDCYLDQRVVLQIGPVTYTETLTSVDPHWLVLTDATITGSRHVAQVVEVREHLQVFNRIAHVYREDDQSRLEVVA